MPSAEPIWVSPRIEQGSHGGVLIRRVLKRSGLPDGPISAVVEVDDPELIALRAAFIDATGGKPALTRPAATAFHVLWCQDEPNAFVRVGVDDAGGLVRRPIGPGDTVYVPPFVPFVIGPGILGYELSESGTTSEESTVGKHHVQPVPTHGLDRFERYNRRTVCAAGPALVLERWKVTRPLPLTLPERRWRLVTNLVEPMAIVWHGGSDLIGRAESRLLPPNLGSCTVIPDGLGYLLASFVPDLLADVITPLRNAGHGDRAIATLGDLYDALRRAPQSSGADDPGQPPPDRALAR